MPKHVTIQRDWDSVLPFKIEYNGGIIRFNSYYSAVSYCHKYNWKFDYDDNIDN